MAKHDLQEIVKRGKAVALQRAELDPPPCEQPLPGGHVPMWREQYRGVPNALIRSALFSVRPPRMPRRYLKGEDIFALSNIRIRYTGEELRQDDASVFMQLLHAARTERLGEKVHFVAYAFICALAWSRNSESYDRLRESITRLTATAVNVQVEERGGTVGYAASLIRSFEYRTTEGEPLKMWAVTLEPAIAALFGNEAYTRVLLEQRLKARSLLAKWLHLYYASHREPFPQTVKALHKLSGSDAKTLYHFRQTLFKALDELDRMGFLKWTITKDDKIIVTRAVVQSVGVLAVA